MQATADENPALRSTGLRSAARTAKRLEDLVEIFEPEVNVVVHARHADRQVVKYLEACLDAGDLIGGRPLVVEAGEAWSSPLDLPDRPGRDALLADIRHLIDLYGELLGCARIGLRLEVLGGAMCPRFHADRVGIRLLCTWIGPGTEWAEEWAVDREHVGCGDSGPVRDQVGVRRASAFDIVLLKGEYWQGNAGHGAIHRSPALDGCAGRRVVLVLDAVW